MNDGIWWFLPSRIRLRIAAVANMTSQTTVAAGAVGALDQRLGDDALQRGRELRADLLLLVRREDVDDPVDGLRGRLRVQRGEHEVAGLGRGQRGRHRLQVAQLADQDDVRVLPQHPLERLGEAGRVDADLALVDHAAAVVVQELDRVLDGDDVVAPLRLARSSRLASVVVLPEPVGPVTSTRPRGSRANRAICSGMPSSCSGLMTCGMARMTEP